MNPVTEYAITKHADTSPIDRNALCPCGSGRRHDRCCGTARRRDMPIVAKPPKTRRAEGSCILCDDEAGRLRSCACMIADPREYSTCLCWPHMRQPAATERAMAAIRSAPRGACEGTP